MDYSDFIGKRVESLPTPALIVDVEALDANLKLLANYFAGRKAKLRPHFKSHKCVTLAHRQLAAGSIVGVTCAKLSEAEVLVEGGVKDILLANQIVGQAKTRRLAALNKKALVRCAVDCAANVAELGAAAVEAGVTIPVLVEVDVGQGRCGVAPGQAAVDLARLVHQTKGLRLDGLQGYEGHLQMLPDPAERRANTLAAMGTLVATRKAVEAAGLPCAIVSGGGTGTYQITGNIEGIDEIQAGSYALMDCNYKRLCPEFRNALSILVTVVSSTPTKAIADVGLKGMGNDFGAPVVVEAPQNDLHFRSEEHLVVKNFSAPVGSLLHVIPSHGCTTCNLHRRLWIHRNGVIEALWPIEASGCLE